MKIDKTVGERIKARRIELGMLQSELAEKVGFKTAPSITLIENGERSLRQDKIKPMAEALGVSIHYIMGVEENENSHNSKKDDPLESLPDEKRCLITEIVTEMAGLTDDEISEIQNQINYILFKRNK